MLSQVTLSGTGAAIVSGVIVGLSLLYYVIQYTRHELRIRKIGGVRAPQLASNPIAGTCVPATLPRMLSSSPSSCTYDM